jgi:hypothetical protein
MDALKHATALSLALLQNAAFKSIAHVTLGSSLWRRHNLHACRSDAAMRGSVEYQVDFKTMGACGTEVASLIVPTRGLRVSEPEPRYTSVARREPRP